MFTYTVNDRGNIELPQTFTECLIKDLTFSIIVKQGRSEFQLDVSEYDLQDICKIANWVGQLGCDLIVKDAHTVVIKYR